MWNPVLLLVILQTVSAAKILCIFPKPAYSHQTVYRGVTEKLLEKGHEITLMSTHPSDDEKTHPNVTLIDVSFSVKLFQKITDEIFETKPAGRKSLQMMLDGEVFLIDKQLSSDGMQKLINDKTVKFDLLLLETAGASPFHVFADHFNIPVVGITSADALSAGHEIMGNVVNPIAHPDRVLPFSVATTFTQRLSSCFFALIFKFMIVPTAAAKYDVIIQKHFPRNTKSYYQLIGNVEIQLINAHPALGFIRPILPNTIPLGFLHVKPPKPLPKDLTEIMDNSKSGVIYMSFGTVVTSKLFENNFATFLSVFAELPFDVLWKYDGESDLSVSVPPNVHLRKWFPQSDLLAHPKVKLFITHGGQHSIEESILRHVPMVICPFHGDQAANAERTAERGISKSLDIHEELSAVRIKSVIEEVIADESFKLNAVKLAKLVEDNPLQSPDKAVWWIEYVIRHRGAKHLNYPQKSIPFYQYHYYDIILSVLGVLTLVLLLIYAAFRVAKMLYKIAMNLKSKRD